MVRSAGTGLVKSLTMSSCPSAIFWSSSQVAHCSTKGRYSATAAGSMKGFSRRRRATCVDPSASAILADGTPGMRGTPMIPRYSIPSGEFSSYLDENVAPSRETATTSS
jgi:hypothetical protein